MKCNTLFLNLLRPALVSELRPDISPQVRRARHSSSTGRLVPAARAFPYQLAVVIHYDPDLAVKTADVAVVALSIELGIIIWS